MFLSFKECLQKFIFSRGPFVRTDCELNRTQHNGMTENNKYEAWSAQRGKRYALHQQSAA